MTGVFVYNCYWYFDMMTFQYTVLVFYALFSEIGCHSKIVKLGIKAMTLLWTS